jgi:uncharacterized protein YoxC
MLQLIQNRDQRRRDIETIKLQIERESQLSRQGDQSLAEQQQVLYERTSSQLSKQTELIRTDIRSSDQRLASLQDGIESVQATLYPVSASVFQLSNALPTVASSMTRLVSLLLHTILMVVTDHL